MWHDIVAEAITTTWAIDENYLYGLLSAARNDDPSRRIKLPKVTGDIVILPIYGVINQRGSVWDELFGGTSTQGLGAAFVRAINDDNVGAVILDVDSPGGTVAGVQEVADLIYAGAQRKPVAAIANSQMASAAYWLGSQVGTRQLRLVAAPGSDVGSIGVFRMHHDLSGMLAQDGIKITFIQSGKYKTEGNPYQELSDEALAFHQGQVDATYDDFISAVSRGRSVAKSAARDGFGQGRMFHAAQAVEMGLVDRVATLGKLVEELSLKRTSGLNKAASTAIENDICHEWLTGEPTRLKSSPHVSIQAQRIAMLACLDK